MYEKTIPQKRAKQIETEIRALPVEELVQTVVRGHIAREALIAIADKCLDNNKPELASEANSQRATISLILFGE